MRTRLELLTTVLLLLASFAWSQWTITSFDDSPEPGEEDNYVAQESSGGLKPVSPDQVVQQGNRLYVRQKFEDPFGDEDATYQIFQGRAKDAAKSLGKISLDGIPYTTLVKMKLFYSRNAKGDDDLEVVYFDGKDIFVEGEEPVFINLNGKMEELKPSVSREFKISLTSDPTGATVLVAGAEKGKTPLTFAVPSSKPITALVILDGYYTVIKPVAPNEKQTLQEGVLLTAKKALDNPAIAYKSQLQTATLNNDANAIKNLKTTVQKTLSSYNSDTKKAIDAIMSKFPANPAKLSNESSSDYSTRQTLWNNAQARERESLNKDGQNYFNELKDLLSDIDASAAEVSKPVVAAKPPPPPPPEDDYDDSGESEGGDDAYYDEEEDEDEYSSGAKDQEERDYSRYAAAQSASDIFGSSDEYLFWTGMVFAAAAVATGVVGFLEHFEWQKANDKTKDVDNLISETKDFIKKACVDAKDPEKCQKEVESFSNQPPDEDQSAKGSLYDLYKWKTNNETIRDSYNKSRIIWWGAAGVSAAISITLFAW